MNDTSFKRENAYNRILQRLWNDSPKKRGAYIMNDTSFKRENAYNRILQRLRDYIRIRRAS